MRNSWIRQQSLLLPLLCLPHFLRIWTVTAFSIHHISGQFKSTTCMHRNNRQNHLAIGVFYNRITRQSNTIRCIHENSVAMVGLEDEEEEDSLQPRREPESPENWNNPINSHGHQIVFVEPGEESETLTSEIWEEIDGAKPPVLWVLKEILAIGGFTYALGIAIVVMLLLNTWLGAGWLGQSMGIAGTGTFSEVSPSLPEVVNLDMYPL